MQIRVISRRIHDVVGVNEKDADVGRYYCHGNNENCIYLDAAVRSP